MARSECSRETAGQLSTIRSFMGYVTKASRCVQTTAERNAQREFLRIVKRVDELIAESRARLQMSRRQRTTSQSRDALTSVAAGDNEQASLLDRFDALEHELLRAASTDALGNVSIYDQHCEFQRRSHGLDGGTLLAMRVLMLRWLVVRWLAGRRAIGTDSFWHEHCDRALADAEEAAKEYTAAFHQVHGPPT